MSTSSTTPITFNGSSTYSSAFQQVITRAVGIASLPVQALQSNVTTLTAQQTELTTVGADFEALQSAIEALGTATAGSPSAQVSNNSAISATASAGAIPGTYTIQVDDPGSSTTTLSDPSLTTVTDPTTGNISSASSFTLTVNGVANTITPTGSSLEDLASAINTAGDGVQATIVNVGSNASPDYRLSVISTSLGSGGVQLNDGTNDLLDTLSLGTDAEYAVNPPTTGTVTDVSSTSSQLTLSPGLTVNLLAASTSPVTINVTNSYSGLQSALSNVVSAYNAAFTALEQNVGQAGGALTGDSLVYTLTNTLSQIAQYTSSGSGSVSTLADLGVTLGSDGQLSFDQSSFSSANSADIQQFFGAVGSSGFLQTANNTLNSVTDPTNGLVATDYNNLQSQITSTNSEISDDQARISTLQTNLQAQLSQADAAIATLQSQNTYFQELFQAEYGTNSASSNG